MRFNFGSSDLVKCLYSLGFTPLKQNSTSHQKFRPPGEKQKNIPGQYSFIMVQLGQKEFDPHARTRYIRQIMRFGYTEKEVIKGFNRK